MELQYDGTGLHGWAKQDGLLTVEGCLESALPDRAGFGACAARGRAHRRRRARAAAGGEPAVCRAAPTCLSLTASLNALTPPGIAVTRIERALAEGFDARKDAVSRDYRYFLCTATVVSPFWSRYCWHTQSRLDLQPAGRGGRGHSGAARLHRLHPG